MSMICRSRRLNCSSVFSAMASPGVSKHWHSANSLTPCQISGIMSCDCELRDSLRGFVASVLMPHQRRDGALCVADERDLHVDDLEKEIRRRLREKIGRLSALTNLKA